VIEPFVRLGDQAWSWSIGFCLLIALLAGCGALRWHSPHENVRADGAAEASPSWKDAGFWMALAAVPAGLLVAVTAHISTDVAAVPLLWVLPLALYLLTFVIVFARQPIIPHWLVVAVQPLFIIVLVAVIIFDPIKTIVGILAVHLVVFFVNALMCHGELARTRPAPRYLTAFYLWISAGGVIGGIGAGLIAPYVFNWVAEYPILIALAVLCRPGLALPGARLQRYFLFGGLAAAALVLIVCALNPVALSETAFNWTVAMLLAASALFWRAPLPFAATIAFILLAYHSIIEQPGTTSVRSFFGVAQDHGKRGRPVPSPTARDHAPWRAAYPRSQRAAGGDRSAGTAALLLGWFRYLGDLRGGALAPRPADPLCGDRPRHRLAGLPRRAG
jgi:hypothetical protein